MPTSHCLLVHIQLATDTRGTWFAVGTTYQCRGCERYVGRVKLPLCQKSHSHRNTQHTADDSWEQWAANALEVPFSGLSLSAL